MVSVFIRAFPFKSTTHRSIVNKDHVYSHTKQHTQPLCEHTQPLYTLMESNFQGPVFIRGFPYKTTHITNVWAPENNFRGTMFIRGSPYKTTHITTMWAHSTYTLLKGNFQGPMFIRVSSYKTTHVTTVCALTTTVYITGKQLSGPHVYKGFPLLWAYTTTMYTTFRATCE